MSHDYDPGWDYPVLDLQAVYEMGAKQHSGLDIELQRLQQLLMLAREQLLPAMEMQDMEVFFVEPFGLGRQGEAVAVYCSGTSSRPVIGIDLLQMQDICRQEGLNLAHQLAVSLAHELAHAYQESLGVEDDHDEDAAELFGLQWASGLPVDLRMLHPVQAQMACPVDQQAELTGIHGMRQA